MEIRKKIFWQRLAYMCERKKNLSRKILMPRDWSRIASIWHLISSSTFFTLLLKVVLNWANFILFLESIIISAIKYNIKWLHYVRKFLLFDSKYLLPLRQIHHASIGIIFERSVFRVWGNITAVNCVSNPPLDHKIESRTREWVFLLHKYLLTTIIIITSAEFYACQLQFS